MAPAKLQKRQREVLSYLDLGWSNGDIAAQMGITVETVKTQVSRLMDALTVEPRTRLALILKARDLTTRAPLAGYHCQCCGNAVLVKRDEPGAGSMRVKTREQEVLSFDYLCPPCEKTIKEALAKTVGELGAVCSVR